MNMRNTGIRRIRIIIIIFFINYIITMSFAAPEVLIGVS